MIRHIWSVFCSELIIDSETNNASLISVYEQLRINRPPGQKETFSIPFRGSLVTLWGREEPTQGEQGMGRMLVKDPNGKELGESLFDVDLTTHERARTRAALSSLPLSVSGRYEFEISLKDGPKAKWRQVSKIPLSVILDEEKSEDDA